MAAPEEQGLELREYLHILRRRQWWVVFVALASVAVALTVSTVRTPVYRATAEVLLRTRVSERIFAPDQQAQTSQTDEVETEIAVMRSRSVRDAVTEALGFEPDVSIAARGDTEVIAISAEDTVPAEAAVVADTYAETYVSARREALVADLLATVDRVQEQIAGIDQQEVALDARITALDQQIAGAPPEVAPALVDQRESLVAEQAPERAALASRRLSYSEQIDELQLASELTQTGGAQIVSAAEEPVTPISPRPRRDAAVALVLGVLAGVALAFLREHFDDSIRTREDLDDASGGSPLLAVVPAFPDWRDRAQPVVASAVAPSSATAEGYRNLRTSLQFIGIDRPTQVIQITSSDSGDGKTTTLANLGVALSRAGQRVVMVDCDLRRPRLHEFFGFDNRIGFTGVVIGDVSPADALQRVEGHINLAVLASGRPPPNPSELLLARQSADVLRRLAADADFVLVDSPPVLPVTDGLVLSRIVDTTVVVASASETTKGELARTFELLGQVDAPVVGVVLNSVEQGDGYYGYGYGLEGTQKEGKRRWPRRRRRRAGSSERSYRAGAPRARAGGRRAPLADPPTRAEPAVRRIASPPPSSGTAKDPST